MIDGYVKPDGTEYRMTSEEIEEWHKNNEWKPSDDKLSDEEIEKQENISTEELEKRIEQQEKEDAEVRKNSVSKRLTDKDIKEMPWETFYIEKDGVNHCLKMRNRPRTTRGFTIITDDKDYQHLRWIIPAKSIFTKPFHLYDIEQGFVDQMCIDNQCYQVLVVGNDKEYTCYIAALIDKYRTGEYIVTNIH